MLLHYLGKLEVQIWWKLHCVFKIAFYFISFNSVKSTDFHNSFTATATVNTFSSVKKVKSAANWKLLQKQLTSSAVRVSQLLHTSPLKAFQLQNLLYDADKFDNRWLRNACLPWHFTDCAVNSGLVLLTEKHIVHLVSIFIRTGTLRSVVALTSVHCARVSELLEQPINASCRPSFVRKFCSQLSRIISLQLV